jgi:hypothetical protein
MQSKGCLLASGETEETIVKDRRKNTTTMTFSNIAYLVKSRRRKIKNNMISHSTNSNLDKKNISSLYPFAPYKLKLMSTTTK